MHLNKYKHKFQGTRSFGKRMFQLELQLLLLVSEFNEKKFLGIKKYLATKAPGSSSSR